MVASFLAAMVALGGGAAAQNVSASKLSVHLLGGLYSPGAKQVVAAGPRVLKVLDLHKDMVDAIRDYKGKHPHGIVVLRVWTRLKFHLADNPESSADRFWSEVLWPHLLLVDPQTRKLIDYVEGPNEGDSTPTWFTDEDTRWFARFWVRLAASMKAQGVRPNVGSIAVGQPPGSPDEMKRRFLLFAPALRAAKEARGSWGYHAYTIHYSTDLEKESWYSLRYRRLHGFLAEAHPELADLPLILTEGGVDYSGDPKTSGWQARGTAKQYQDWLQWFDRELRKDPYVVGVTLFQMGDPGIWPSFELEPISAWLADWLRRP
jgi:hypothetical protein